MYLTRQEYSFGYTVENNLKLIRKTNEDIKYPIRTLFLSLQQLQRCSDTLVEDYLFDHGQEHDSWQIKTRSDQIWCCEDHDCPEARYASKTTKIFQSY